MKNVVIYSTPTCHYCHGAKDFFKSHDIPFTDYNVAADKAKAEEMIQKTGQMGVPAIFIDDELVMGFDEERLKELLGVK